MDQNDLGKGLRKDGTGSEQKPMLMLSLTDSPLVRPCVLDACTRDGRIRFVDGSRAPEEEVGGQTAGQPTQLLSFATGPRRDDRRGLCP